MKNLPTGKFAQHVPYTGLHIVKRLLETEFAELRDETFYECQIEEIMRMAADHLASNNPEIHKDSAGFEESIRQLTTQVLKEHNKGGRSETYETLLGYPQDDWNALENPVSSPKTS